MFFSVGFYDLPQVPEGHSTKAVVPALGALVPHAWAVLIPMGVAQTTKREIRNVFLNSILAVGKTPMEQPYSWYSLS